MKEQDTTPRVEVWATPWNRSVGLRITSHDHTAAILLPEMQAVAEGDEIPATVEISFNRAQELMDGLWSAGVRPTEGTGSAGSLAATERHLEDMRAMVFSVYDVDAPK